MKLNQKNEKTLKDKENILIYYGSPSNTIFQKSWLKSLETMPLNIKRHCLKFRFKEDQQKRLLGYLLLQKALRNHQISSNELNHLDTNKHKKPYFSNLPKVNFSLSYSKDISICAFSIHHKIGIDVEKIEELDIEDFREIFSKRNWEKIQSAPNSLHCFYHFWTILEAVSKANGDGILGPIQDIEYDTKTITYQNKKWTIKEITELHQEYKIHLSIAKTPDTEFFFKTQDYFQTT